ncbi:hypothetical protein FQR65_LT00854 [Abscondita terminalis]|nr:hypothetical protein FQR65_LT00854 [Abscondita terminalis]
MIPTSKIQTYFNNKCVFITGGTGYLGGLLIEKLLRSCASIGKIYVLCRGNEKLSYQKRLEQLLNEPIFANIKADNPEILKKLISINGNLDKTNLGIDVEDWNLLINEVNCVFHVGSSIDFSMCLSSAIKTNLSGTIEITKLAKKIKNLESFIYVSSVYAHTNSGVITENLCESRVTGEDLLRLMEQVGMKNFNEFSSKFLENSLNSYTYSKYLSEDYLRRNAQELPTAILRPSILTSTLNEPFSGWGNISQPYVQAVAGIAAGIIHILRTKSTNILDIIPPDFVVNQMIAIAWYIGTSQKSTKNSISVYNCASSSENPLTWELLLNLVKKYILVFPLYKKIWHPFCFLSTSVWIKNFFYLLQMPQMYFFDFVSFLLRKPRMFLNLYKNAHTSLYHTECFIKSSWIYSNRNTRQLWEKLEDADKKTFNFDITSLKWESLVRNSVEGVRHYVLKEDPATIPKASTISLIFKVLNYAVMLVPGFIVFYILQSKIYDALPSTLKCYHLIFTLTNYFHWVCERIDNTILFCV